MKKKYYSMKRIKAAKENDKRKMTSNITLGKESKALIRKEARQDTKKDARKKERKGKQHKSLPKEIKSKQRSSVDLRILERKKQRQSQNIKERKEDRQIARERKKDKNVAKRIEERKQKRRKSKKGERQQRKKKRKEKRKKARKKKSMRIENSVLGKSIPKGRLKDFKKKFVRGKLKTKRFASFKFLNNLDFPYSGSGDLRRDFRQLVKKKVINKLPEYCEEAKIEKSKKVKDDCKKRAKRIKERILERLKKNEKSSPLSKNAKKRYTGK